MKHLATTAFFIIGVAVWLGTQPPVVSPQAPRSDLPPVSYSLGPDSQPQPGVPKGTLILNKPEFTATPITTIAFGGPGRTWLYVTQGGRLFRRETRRAGVVAWEPVKPPQPGL